MNTYAPQIKFALSALGGWLWALYAPVFPYAGVCMFLVIINGVTALMMRRRMAGRALWPSARDLGRLVALLTRVNVALLAASLVQDVVLAGSGLVEVNVLKLTAALICFWQLLGILEHESAASGARWARIVRRRLISAALRHGHAAVEDDGDDHVDEVGNPHGHEGTRES